jgi:hypothetical protein
MDTKPRVAPAARRRATIPRRSSPWTIFCLIAVALCACLALAACGGSGGSDPSGELSGQRVNEQKMVKFAKCLREHGVDAETSKGSEGKGFGIHITSGGAQGKEGGSPSGPPPQFKAAQSACKRYAPAAPFESLTPAQKAEEKQKALEFARCMRSHGVEVPDPGPSGVLELNNINPQSATFEGAQNACHHLMGRLPLAIRASSRGPGPGSGGGQESSSSGAAPPAGGGGE